MGWAKELLLDAEDAERAAWKASSNGRGHYARVRQESALRAADEAAAVSRREKAWAADWPREWQEWQRIRLLLVTQIEFGHDFDFEEFLKEVGRAPSPRDAIQRSREDAPYQPGNLCWVDAIPEAPASPYLTAKEAAAYLGIALQTLRNNRSRYRPVNATKPLMYDKSDLDNALRGLKRDGRR